MVTPETNIPDSTISSPDLRQVTQLLREARAPAANMIQAVGQALKTADGTESEPSHPEYQICVGETVPEYSSMKIGFGSETIVAPGSAADSPSESSELSNRYNHNLQDMASPLTNAKKALVNVELSNPPDCHLGMPYPSGNVLFADTPGKDTYFTPPGHMIGIPPLYSERSSVALMNATLATVERINNLAHTELVQQELAKHEVADFTGTLSSESDGDVALEKLDGKVVIARGADEFGEVFGSNREAELNAAPIRMFVEAAATVANTTAILVADIESDLDMAKVIRSMDKNGVYKFLAAMMPAGVIGPLASNGYMFPSASTLDQEALAQGEFALSKSFKDMLVEHHKIVMEEHLSKLGLATSLVEDRANGISQGMSGNTRVKHAGKESKGTVVGMGCSASPQEISMVAQMVAARVG